MSIKTCLSFLIYGMLLLAGVKAMMNMKTWTYELKSTETDSNHPDKMNFDLHVERVSRGVHSISGNVVINVAIVEGDDHEMMASAYRSDNGVSEYKLIPFTIPRQHIYKYMDTYYKDMIMETLRGCSDLPAFEGKFVPPLEQKTYYLDKCQFNQDGFPNHLQDGFYKVVVAGFGPVEWSLVVVVEVEQI